MNIEALLELAVETLRDTGGVLYTNALRDKMTRQFMESADQLEVLLSLDSRFVRDSAGGWRLIDSQPERRDAISLGQHAAVLCEQSIEALLAEQETLEQQTSQVGARLMEVDDQLGKLGVVNPPLPQIGLQPRPQRPARVRIPEGRYKSLWPLPGGRGRFVKNLTMILEQIDKREPSLEVLTAWATKEWQVGGWAQHAILDCAVYPGLASLDQDRLVLTPDGKRFLQTADRDIAARCFRDNIWGMDEILLWLAKRPMSQEEILNSLNDQGAGWQRPDQVMHRLNWLMDLGQIEEDGSTRPSRYRIVRG